jgi:hypothetical protein
MKFKYLYSFIAFLLFTAHKFVAPEVVLVVLLCTLILLLFHARLSISDNVFMQALPFIAVAALGIAGGMHHSKYEMLKDIIAYLKPAVVISVGYLLFRFVKTGTLLEIFVFSALIISANQVLAFILNPQLLQQSLNDIRHEAGTGSLVIIAGIALLVESIRSKNVSFIYISPVIRYAGLVLCTSAMFLSFSRSMIFCLVLLLLTMTNIIKTRGLYLFRTALVMAAIVAAGYFMLDYLSGTIDSTSTWGTFIHKMKRAPEEITLNDSYHNLADIYSNWRGYEAAKAMNQFWEGSTTEHFTGLGFGTLVDLEFYTFLGGTEFRYINKLHNGFIDILYKTGFLGISIYVLYFLFQTIRPMPKLSEAWDKPAEFSYNLLSGIGLIILFTTPVIAGALNKSTLDPLLIVWGYLLARIEYIKNISRYIKIPDKKLFLQI